MPSVHKHVLTSYRHIWSLSWPVLLSNISLPLVGAVDVAMMGRMTNETFIAGVALGTLLFTFFYRAFGFLRMGTTAFTAQAHGAQVRGAQVRGAQVRGAQVRGAQVRGAQVRGAQVRGAQNQNEILHIFARNIIIALSASLIIIAIYPLLINIATVWIEASIATKQHMTTYLNIRIWGLPFVLINAVMLGWLFGVQSMRLCMMQMIFINGTNIILNLVFVLGFKLNVTGVALASLVAEMSGTCLMLSIIYYRLPYWGLALKPLTKSVLWAQDKWLNMGLIARDLSLRTMLLWGVEAALLTQAATYGDIKLAAMQVILVMFGFIAFGLDGFAHATEALVGHAIGARQKRMLKLVIRRTTFLAGLMALAMSLTLWLGGSLLIPLFTNQPALISAIEHLWIWCIILPIVSCLAFQMDGIYIGAAAAQILRNGMIIAFCMFFVVAWSARQWGIGLESLMLALITYLLMRGGYLSYKLPLIYRLCQQGQQDQQGQQGQ